MWLNQLFWKPLELILDTRISPYLQSRANMVFCTSWGVSTREVRIIFTASKSGMSAAEYGIVNSSAGLRGSGIMWIFPFEMKIWQASEVVIVITYSMLAVLRIEPFWNHQCGLNQQKLSIIVCYPKNMLLKRQMMIDLDVCNLYASYQHFHIGSLPDNEILKCLREFK
jgi:hypothetical protein